MRHFNKDKNQGSAKHVKLFCLASAIALLSAASYACNNHGPGFGFYPMSTHMESAASLSNQLAEGMALTAEPRYTINLGETAEVPFTAIVPESFAQAKVTWQTDETVNLTGAADMAIDSGTEQELMLSVAPSKAGTYVLRGKLSAMLEGNSASKSSFILIKVLDNRGTGLAKNTN